MEMLTTWERYAREEGVIIGQIKMMLSLMVHKFGTLPDSVVKRVKQIKDEAVLEEISKQVLTADSLDEIDLGAWEEEESEDVISD